MEHLTPHRMGAPRLLVVEDTQALRVAIMRCLEHLLRMDLVGVGSVAEAREEIRRHRPAAVLLDLMIPEEHGTVLLREIRAAKLPIRVVVWTGIDACHGLKHEALALGPDDFLTKPQPLADLVAALLPAESPSAVAPVQSEARPCPRSPASSPAPSSS